MSYPPSLLPPQKRTPAVAAKLCSRSKSALAAFRVLALAVFSQLVFSTLPALAQEPVYYDYPLNASKVQPLKSSKLPEWLVIDGELRGRIEGQTSLNLVPSNDRIYVLTRVRGGIMLKPTSFLHGYLQFHDTHALGLPLPQVIYNQRDTFDLFQGYADIHAGKLDLITGRQLLRYGGERIVGISDWTNNSRSWDGFDGHYGDKNYIEAFATSVVTVYPTSLDKHGAGLTFYGVVGMLATPIPKTQVQPYVYVRRNPAIISQQGIRGSEVETTFGVEANGYLPGRFHYDVLGDLQRGTYSNDSIHSGAGYIKVSHQTRGFLWKPRFGGEYDYATGNPHRNPYRMSTNDQLYPSNHNAFGLEDLFGFQNITESRVNINLTPKKDLTLLVQGEALHVASVRDDVYSSITGSVVKAPAAGFSNNDIGQGFDASGEYVFRKWIDVQAGVGHFFPGHVMTQGGKPSPLTLGYFQLDYRFKASNK